MNCVAGGTSKNASSSNLVLEEFEIVGETLQVAALAPMIGENQ